MHSFAFVTFTETELSNCNENIFLFIANVYDLFVFHFELRAIFSHSNDRLMAKKKILNTPPHSTTNLIPFLHFSISHYEYAIKKVSHQLSSKGVLTERLLFLLFRGINKYARHDMPLTASILKYHFFSLPHDAWTFHFTQIQFFSPRVLQSCGWMTKNNNNSNNKKNNHNIKLLWGCLTARKSLHFLLSSWLTCDCGLNRTRLTIKERLCAKIEQFSFSSSNCWCCFCFWCCSVDYLMRVP
jgi:hypothetical protein